MTKRVVKAETVWILGVQGVFRKCPGCGKYKRISHFGMVRGNPESHKKRFASKCNDCYLPLHRDNQRSTSRSYTLTPKGRQYADDLLKAERAERRANDAHSS